MSCNECMFCSLGQINNDFFMPLIRIAWVSFSSCRLSFIMCDGLCCPALDHCSHRFVYCLKLHVSIYMEQYSRSETSFGSFAGNESKYVWEIVLASVCGPCGRSVTCLHGVSHDALTQGSAETETSQQFENLPFQPLRNRIKYSFLKEMSACAKLTTVFWFVSRMLLVF